jgi:hypothetical protein
VLVAAVFSVQASSGGFRDRSNLLGLEGLHGACAFFGPLGGARHRVVTQAEGVFAPRVLEDRMQNLAVDVHRAGADRLAVHPGQESANVLGRYRAQLVPRERAHDPRSSLPGTICLWPGEHGPVAVEGGGLGSLLELQVLQPDLDRILEARLPHPRSDLLLRFDLGDHLAHLHVGAALIQEALPHATTPPPPAALSVRFEPGPPQPALALRSRRVPPLHFVEGLVLVGAHVQRANSSPVRFHRGLQSLVASSLVYVQRARHLHRAPGRLGTDLGTNARRNEGYRDLCSRTKTVPKYAYLQV